MQKIIFVSAFEGISCYIKKRNLEQCLWNR